MLRGRWEEGSGLGTRVYPWWIHVDVWQNQYNIVKLKRIIKNNKFILKNNKNLKIVTYLNSEVNHYTWNMIFIGCNTAHRRASINIL